MGKQKTHKGLIKRVKVTGSGKVMRKRAGAGHLMSTKNAKRRRRLTGSTVITGVSADTIKVRLGK